MAPKPTGREAGSGGGLQHCERHRPAHTLLCKLVEEHYPVFAKQMATQGTPLPKYVQREFDAYLACGRLKGGFLRVACETCRAEQLVAVSCRRREFCPSCGARRRAECAALLVDEILPREPIRQWVLTVPVIVTAPGAVKVYSSGVFGTIAKRQRYRALASAWDNWLFSYSLSGKPRALSKAW